MALVRLNRKWMLDPIWPFTSCIFPIWKRVSTEHRPGGRQAGSFSIKRSFSCNCLSAGVSSGDTARLWCNAQAVFTILRRGLSCFSSLDNYFRLIPACQGQSWPSIEARDRATSHHRSSSLHHSSSVSLGLSLWLQDPLFPSASLLCHSLILVPCPPWEGCIVGAGLLTMLGFVIVIIITSNLRSSTSELVNQISPLYSFMSDTCTHSAWQID